MRRFLAWAIFLVLALTLTACVSMDAGLTLHADGSGARVVQIWVDETAYRLALVGGAPDPLAQIAAEAGRRGATVEATRDYARQGLRLTQTFDRLGDIPSLPPLDDVTATRQSDGLNTRYAVTVTVHLDQLAALAQGLEQLPLGSLQLTYRMTLPGRIRAHNAATVSGNTLVWTLHPATGGVQVLTAVSEVPHDFTAAYVLGVAGVLTLLLGMLGALIFAHVRQRRQYERPRTVMSGCLGTAIGMWLVACLALALLTGYLVVEGRIFPVGPVAATPIAP